jgi:hypothetical protein
MDISVGRVIVQNAHPSHRKDSSIIGTNAPPVIKFCVGFLFLFDFLCERNVQSQSAGSLSIIYKWSAIYVARERALPGIAKFMPQGWWASSMGLRGVLCLRNTPLGRSAHRKLRTRVCVCAENGFIGREKIVSPCVIEREDPARARGAAQKNGSGGFFECCGFNQRSYRRSFLCFALDYFFSLCNIEMPQRIGPLFARRRPGFD